MNIDTNTIVPISLANQNFSKVARLVDDDKYEVFQWLLSIAGDLTFRFHAYSLVQYALREWYQVDD